MIKFDTGKFFDTTLAMYLLHATLYNNSCLGYPGHYFGARSRSAPEIR
jgi:hypothetical protein